jgi:hypothetical protein
MPSISYEVYCRSLDSVINDERIRIPEHQRPEIWSKSRQQKLIKTVMQGRPMPSLIIRETIDNGERSRWLEDGQQRYISMKNFYNNKFPYNNTLYKDFSESERVKFLTYKIPVLTYENATIEETIEMFDNFQNGVPLSPGQRFHARLDTPLVKYARERLLTPGMHFYTRATAVWGAHESRNDTKTKRNLMNAMAIVGGVAHGADHITTSYDVLGPILTQPFNIERADSLLDKVLKVYEETASYQPFTPDEKKSHWPVGQLTGYVLASLISNPTDETVEKWVSYIMGVRGRENRYYELHANMPASRSWNAARWNLGYDNIFVNRHLLANTGVVENETSEEEY